MTEEKMTEKELKRIAERIAKCLALASSSNPHEAENAKRQAYSLMQKYNMTTGDIAAAQVHEQTTKTGGKYQAPVYLSQLANMIAKAFACKAILDKGFGFNDSEVIFLGLGIKPDLAAYTFDVLRKQITSDRANYLKTLKRYKRCNKIRMADLFCDGWLGQIYNQVHDFAGSDDEQEAIDAYIAKKFDIKTNTRTVKKPQNDRDFKAIFAGNMAGKDVQLHKPVQTRSQTFLH